ncbi:MAG: hypothetical protein ACRELY_05255, partial [Polyangiaceae bacterium]
VMDITMQRSNFAFEQSSDTGQDGGQTEDYEPFGTVTPDVWRNVRISTDFQRVQIYVDGVDVYDQALLLPISSATGVMYVGQGVDGDDPSWSYRIDNVVCVSP